jgi:hypothetical protein
MVGQPSDDKKTIALVWCARFGSCQHVPPRIVPERGQVTEYRSKGSASVHGKQPWDVLDRHEPWTYSANNPRELGPEPTRIPLPTAATSDACRLAREPAAHNADGFELVGGNVPDIFEPNSIGPVFCEDRETGLVMLYLPSRRPKARKLKASFEAAGLNAREQRTDCQLRLRH